MEIDEQTKYTVWNWSTSTWKQRTYAKRVLMPDDNPEDIKFHVTLFPWKDNANCRIRLYWCEIEVWDRKTDHWICDIRLSKDSSSAWYTFEYDS